MAYLGSKTGEQLLAAQHRADAAVMRSNAKLLVNDLDHPDEWSRLIVEADRLEAQADEMENAS